MQNTNKCNGVSPPCKKRALSEYCDYFGKAFLILKVFMKQSILNNPILIKLIGLDSHIMLCQIEQWLKQKSPCRISYLRWKKVFPFWNFNRYFQIKQHLKNKRLILEMLNKKKYIINFKKLKGLIQER